ncbi:unnamed protein product [Gongylonema pulchrum]|uniref:Chloride channel CLIC-like protein 1 n=1 Tax=Gongylonema pulchrum TaxID=637853 RepID=A0A183DPP7_9BILA|nr:unnamed protein product [Gongylonema pulchrum]
MCLAVARLVILELLSILLKDAQIYFSSLHEFPGPPKDRPQIWYFVSVFLPVFVVFASLIVIFYMFYTSLMLEGFFKKPVFLPEEAQDFLDSKNNERPRLMSRFLTQSELKEIYALPEFIPRSLDLTSYDREFLRKASQIWYFVSVFLPVFVVFASLIVIFYMFYTSLMLEGFFKKPVFLPEEAQDFLDSKNNERPRLMSRFLTQSELKEIYALPEFIPRSLDLTSYDREFLRKASQVHSARWNQKDVEDCPSFIDIAKFAHLKKQP